jgi:hypothetical protein
VAFHPFGAVAAAESGDGVAIEVEGSGIDGGDCVEELAWVVGEVGEEADVGGDGGDGGALAGVHAFDEI